LKLNLGKLAALLIFVFSLLVYVATLAPSVFWWDSGEFIANVSSLGIPHRPGFPLYILLAKVFTLFSTQNLSWWTNLFSAVCAAISLALVYRIFMRISIERFSSKRHKVLAGLVGLGVVLLFGFNYSFWIQAVRAEVYSLAVLLFSLLFWLAVKTETSPSWPRKTQLLLFLVAGLSLSNHPAIALSTLPALLFLLLTKSGQAWKPKTLLASILLFLFGVSVYLYLPLRSANQPALNWLNPADWQTYLRTILASGTAGPLQQFDRHLLLNLFGICKIFFQQLGIFPLLLAGVGFWSLGPRRRRWLWFAMLLTLFNWLVLGLLTEEFIPNNPDLHGYLLPSLLIWSLSFGWGSLYLLNRTYLFFSQSMFTRPLKIIVTSTGVLFLLFISAIPGYQSRVLCDLSSNPLPEQYGRQAVTDLEYGSLVVIDNPNLDFLLRGLQYGEGFRKDLIVVDRTLLPAEWYCQQLKHDYPNLFTHIPSQLTGEKLALNLATSHLNRGKAVYWEFAERDTALVKYLVPVGYLSQIVKQPQQFDSLWEKQIDWEAKNLTWDAHPAFKFDGDAQRVWSRVMFNLGYFYERQGMLAEAADKYRRILALSPDEDLVTRRLKIIGENQIRAGE
jgi:hypothetical protein